MIITVHREGGQMVRVRRDWDGDAYAAALILMDLAGEPRNYLTAHKAAKQVQRQRFVPVSVDGVKDYFLIRK